MEHAHAQKNSRPTIWCDTTQQKIVLFLKNIEFLKFQNSDISDFYLQKIFHYFSWFFYFFFNYFLFVSIILDFFNVLFFLLEMNSAKEWCLKVICRLPKNGVFQMQSYIWKSSFACGGRDLDLGLAAQDSGAFTSQFASWVQSRNHLYHSTLRACSRMNKTTRIFFSCIANRVSLAIKYG